ncbi:MAG TPA: PA14 domain-containing protein [bacterium]|nr:PA14 domain-containing protein [bacterium]
MDSRHGRFSTENPSSSSASPALALGLAALGQIFLIQSGRPWTLFPGMLFYAAAVLILLRRPFLSGPSPVALFPGWERGLFGLILALGLFLRLFRLDDFPPGLHTDQGSLGLFALRILHEGWRPGLESLLFQNPFPLEYYQLAAWFSVLEPSPFTLRLFFIALSMAGLLLAYCLFRRLAGPGVALTALFLLAVMRWDWIECRNPHSSAEVPFYLLGMMLLFLEARLRGGRIPLAASALLAALGLYAYQSLKVLPLLWGALLWWEGKGGKDGWAGRKSLLPALALLAALSLPYVTFVFSHGSLGKREGEVFLFKKVWEENSLRPLADSWGGTLLMTNREGTWNPFHNLPGHRMLDDITGALFPLGLALAWRSRKERKGAYPLMAFAVMALPGLMTQEPGTPHRFLGLAPWVAYFAALMAREIGMFLASLFPGKKPLVAGALGFLLLSAGAQNAWTYFHFQAGEDSCREAYGFEQNQVGEALRRMEGRNQGQFHYFLASPYFRNYTEDFLAYPARDRMIRFDPAAIAAGNFLRDLPAVFFLEGGQKGVLDFLQGIFPGGRAEILRDSHGTARLCRFNAPPESLALFKGWWGGLQGLYQAGSADKPVSTLSPQPLVNFASFQDFPYGGLLPYRAAWTGKISISQSGDYAFKVLASDPAALWLDGKPAPSENPVWMVKGMHPLRLEFEKSGGPYAALHLVWQKPGDPHWEIVPATAFGGRKP